jgi:hypothetical protein
MSRPQIEILDESPQVKDRRKRVQQPVYQIVVPPMPGGTGNGSAMGAGGSAPGVITITPNQNGAILAPAGFQSNIPAVSPMAGKQLPFGASIGVHAKMDRPVAAAPRPGALLHAAGRALTTSINSYSPAPVAAASGLSSKHTSLDVHATMQHGSLLKQK